MNVSLFDLKEQNKKIEHEIKEAINRIIQSGQFILGEDVRALEEEIASYLKIKHAIAVASGTDALLLSLKGCGISQGDEVITTPFTFIATVEAIIHAGAKPVFADILPDTFSIDPLKIKEKVTSKTKAVMPVHMYGHPCDMEEICDIARANNLSIIEDTAQGFGAIYKERYIGTIGDCGCFSFFPTKNLGAFGDAGMVVTNDDDVAERIRKLRVHGSDRKYIHELIGYNSRLDAIQAAVLRVKLRYIDKWNEKRIEIAEYYNRLLAPNAELVLPIQKTGSRHIYHQYTVMTKKRDELKSYLNEKGIVTAVHYPLPVFEQTCLAYLNCQRDELINSHKASRTVLCLPIYPELKDEEARYVCKEISNFFQ